MKSKIENYYDNNINQEINRLNKDYYSSLEKKIVLYLVEKYFPKKSTLLDIGGGPGSYSKELLDMGFNVTLVDISQKQVDFANVEFKDNKKFKASKMNVLDLSSLNNKYDCIILLGPLYHILGKDKQSRAIAECKKVLKNDGIILAAGISYLGTIRSLIKWEHWDFFVSDEVYENPMIDEYNYVTPKNHSFVDMSMTRVDPFRQLFEEQGFETISMAGSKGLFAGLDYKLNNAPYNVKFKVEKMLINSCEDDSIVGFSEHIFYLGRYSEL